MTKAHVPAIVKANEPDLDVAVGAILPLFRALLDGRLKRHQGGEPERIRPVRTDESRAD